MRTPARMGRESHYFSTQRKLGRDGEKIMKEQMMNSASNEACIIALGMLLSIVIIHIMIASTIPAIIGGMAGLYVIRRELLTA